MKGLLLVGVVALAGCGAMGPKAGEKATAQKEAQPLTPVEQINTWLDGMHVAKDDVNHMAEVQHYCDVVDDDLIQCALYDRSGARAHLVGVEYIVSEEAFGRLPPREREYWHPHNYEVLSGMLVAPEMPKNQEQALMRRLLNTYGKTWHTWPTGPTFGQAPNMPVGEPELAWSFNADGEAPDALIQARERRLGIDLDEVRRERQSLVRDANPQEGVNAMAKDFPNRRPIRGVREVYPTDRQRGTE